MFKLTPHEENLQGTLGPIVRVWEPLPFKEAANVHSKDPRAMKSSSLFMFYMFACFFASAYFITVLFQRPMPPMKDPAFYLFFVITLVPGILFSYWRFYSWHKNLRLSLFEKGFRFQKHIILIDDIDSILLGGLSREDKLLPTLQKLRDIRWPGYQKIMDKFRQSSLTVKLNNGKEILLWSIALFFQDGTIPEFFAALEERSPRIYGGRNEDVFFDD